MSQKGVYEREVSLVVSPAELAAHPWAFRCEQDGCYYGVCTATQDEAEHERVAHGCPRTGETVGKSIIQKAWDILDGLMDGYMALSDTYNAVKARPDREGAGDVARQLQGQAQRAHGVCEVIALLMVPHFTTADAVWAEAVVRYQARQSGAYHHTEGVR
jgi:hypothetical protein